ncbi:MFS transporter [Nostoc sp. 3335mG]|nr:MFS transporter [Nostoc sp. 3335mG]
MASITAFAMMSGFGAFLVAPMLDVRFSRRSYAIGFAILAAGSILAALLNLDDPGRLRWLLFAAIFGANLFQGAVGGWVGSLAPEQDKGRLGGWFVAGNIAGSGIAALLNITLYRALPAPFGAIAIAAFVLLPLLSMIAIPAPGPDRRLASESFRTFFREIGQMVRRPTVVRTMAIFAVPAGCFALTNMLAGLGRDFGASEYFVAAVAGIGVTIAGLAGSLGIPRITARIPAFRVYCAIAFSGALFTLSLLLLPRTPATFALAMVGENIAQAAAFATAAAIIFREIGEDNPLAATEFMVLHSFVVFPVFYMQYVDGRSYARGHLTGALLTDGLLGLAGGVAILSLLMTWPGGRRAPHGPA